MSENTVTFHKKDNIHTTQFFQAEVKSYDPEKHTMVFVITSPAKDYSGESINPDGVKFSGSPKLLAGHDQRIPAIGKVLWVGREGLKWKMGVWFDQEDPLAVLYEWKYSQGIMTDCSIGFIAELKSITNEDGLYVYNDITIVEVSLVNIGDNPDAHNLAIDECELIMKSISNNEVKKYFENIKNKKLMEQVLEELKTKQADSEQMLKDILSRLDSIQETLNNMVEEEQEEDTTENDDTKTESTKDVSLTDEDKQNLKQLFSMNIKEQIKKLKEKVAQNR